MMPARKHICWTYALPLFGTALLAGCGQNDADPGPGGVTVGEARALDEAAEMIEQRRLPAQALEESPAQDADAGPPAATGGE